MKPWTEAHRQEAQRRTYEIAAQMVSDGYGPTADRLALDLRADISSEKDWVSRMFRWSGLGAARIKREVRRVRALADGRLVRETSERHVSPEGIVVWQGPPGQRMMRGLRRIRVTRIRRARAKGTVE